jgi:hypothetical protein
LKAFCLLMVCLTSTLSAPSWGDINRSSWVLEQIGQAPLPPLVEEMKNQAAVHAVTYTDAASTQASVLANAKWFEVGAKAGSRFFGGFTKEGKDFEAAASGQRTHYSFEVARSYVSKHGHYGRGGIEYIQFTPDRWRLLRIGFNTGILETEDSPSFLRVNLSLFKKIAGDGQYSDVLFVNSEIGHRYWLQKNSQLRVGGFLTWVYRQNNGTDPPSNTRVEHMLLSMGPFAEYGVGALRVRLSAPWRIWIDRHTVKVPDPKVAGTLKDAVTYPNKFRWPDVAFSVYLTL